MRKNVTRISKHLFKRAQKKPYVMKFQILNITEMKELENFLDENKQLYLKRFGDGTYRRQEKLSYTKLRS